MAISRQLAAGDITTAVQALGITASPTFKKTTFALTAAAQLFVSDPTGVTGNGGVTWGAAYGPTAWTNGPSGQINYIDDVYTLGLNVLTPGGRVDGTKPSLYLQWESKFQQPDGDAGKFGSEFHTEFITSSGTSLRPDYSFYPHDGGTGSIRQIQADTIVFDKLVGTGGGAPIQFDMLNKYLLLQNSAMLRQVSNNVPITAQIKADLSGYLNGLYLNASNVWQLSAPLQSAGAITSTAPMFYGVVSTAANNSTQLKVEGGSATTLQPFQFFASTTGDYIAEIRNQNTANLTGRAGLMLRTSNANSGDPLIQYDIAFGTATWSHGLDNSDSDRFKFSASATLGTTDILTMDALGNVALGSAAIATNATDGFLYIDSGAGAPTGTPTTYTGRVPIYYDATNDQLYVYRGGWKQPKTPAGAALVNWQ